jgi:hypothetical protein
MVANASLFPGGSPTTEVRLRGLGYAADGSRSGGIVFGARTVMVPVGSYLARLYHKDGDFGEWWFTPHEYARAKAYFGVAGDVLSQGRAGGRSAMHGLFALLSEWYGKDGNADQLSRFHVVCTRAPVQAMYGEGDVATTADFGRTLKPIRLENGKAPRQLFLPSAWDYKEAFAVLTAPGNNTDSGLDRALGALPDQVLPFETATGV